MIMGNVTLFMRPTQLQLNEMRRFAHCYEGNPPKSAGAAFVAWAGKQEKLR